MWETAKVEHEPPRRARRPRQGDVERRRAQRRTSTRTPATGGRFGRRRTATTRPRPRLVVQNLTFARGNSTGDHYEGGGGGAISPAAAGSRSSARGSPATAATPGASTSAAPPCALSQSGGRPVYVVRSTFTRGVCSNGAALSSIGVSVDLQQHLHPQPRDRQWRQPGARRHAGRRLGRRDLHDGNTFRVLIAGNSDDTEPRARGRRRVFFVSNDRTGTLEIRYSTLRRNPSIGFETDPGIYFLGRDQKITRSVVR